MKILVTGYSGQLGFDVVNEGLKRGLNMIGTDRKDLDITNESSVNDFVKKIMPDAIIHCGAYTAVDKAEEDREACWNVNVNGTKYLAAVSKKINAKFMYISTDYIFNGQGNEPFDVNNQSQPVNYYGHTKLEGEKVVKSILNNWYIIRISWVFGVNGNNFVKTMLRLSENRNELNVVSDQYGSPTYTKDLSRLLIDMILTDKYGIFHATNEGFCNWAEFAQEIFKLAGKSVKVNPISTEQYPTMAARPRNSRMSKQNLIENDFEPLRQWKEALAHYINEIKQEVK
ncbi:dTDP-4-dehydrorhamnose reductase [Bacillus sp. HMF5848]|uniref:dTDP-4-dehydrorhamnose reductase n=1 Tax=Bacillus sp. HMF5848 TaxID=2495421 RepID=UPI000F7B7F5F|nr:dTDP-4-dehydrorhamnose reductase [Bacillus sp. HMF5848]RSK28854.1 dTDP-4-dehydrorhamnose reductase [Bacillus sp. HMF5848]